MKQAAIFIIVFAILAGAAISQEQGEATFDQAHPELFDYENGNYALITDWSVVDWAKIPSERVKDVPVERLEYQSLTPAQRKEMTTGQIAINLEKIEDLFSDVSAATAAQALQQTYGITEVHFFGGCRVRDGVLEALGNDKETLPLSELSPAANVRVTDYGRILLSNEPKPPATGTFVLQVFHPEEITMPSGIVVTIFGKRDTNNLLHFAEGQPYLDEGKELTVNGIIIQPIGVEVPLYFAGQQGEGTYVAMDFTNKKLRIGGTSPNMYAEIFFTKPNQFFPVEEGDYVLLNAKGGELTVSNRGDDLVPLVSSTVIPGGNAQVMNGATTITLGDKKIIVDHHKNAEIGSAPMVIVPKEGSSASFSYTDQLGFTQQGKIIMDNNNNYAIIPTEAPADAFECYDCTQNFFDQYLVLHNANMWRLLNTGASVVTGSPKEVMRVLDYTSQLPEGWLAGSWQIDIVPKEEIPINCHALDAYACAAGNTIYLPEDTGFFAVAHEFAHVYTNHVTSKFPSRSSDPAGLEEYKLNLLRRYELIGHDVEFSTVQTVLSASEDASDDTVRLESLCDQPMSETEGICYATYLIDKTTANRIPLQSWESRQIREFSEGPQKGFMGEWDTIAGDVYGKDLEAVTENQLPNHWTDGSDDPRHGCIRAYGCRNDLEDIATIIEFVMTDPSFFSRESLIQPPGHQEHDPERYDQRLTQKIHLL
ncbi:hypothetical protein HYU19_02595 [Candidatus Woesearchaeota archaeon]|nr:hypothetical protein [Candidatus Woesearchaeota archaeon]